MNAKQILDAVEGWASDRWMLLREIGACVDGRLDGLLVPISMDAMSADKECGGWTDKMHLFGVEVKASRADFMAGVKRGQFEKYVDGGIAGLFVATNPEIKTREVPASVGHLIVRGPDRFLTDEYGSLRKNKFSTPDWRCSCRRMPTIRREPMTEETMWRVMFRVIQNFKATERANRSANERTDKKIGELIAGEIRRIREAQ